jgi:hypothetical protein
MLSCWRCCIGLDFSIVRGIMTAIVGQSSLSLLLQMAEAARL